MESYELLTDGRERQICYEYQTKLEYFRGLIVLHIETHTSCPVSDYISGTHSRFPYMYKHFSFFTNGFSILPTSYCILHLFYFVVYS